MPEVTAVLRNGRRHSAPRHIACFVLVLIACALCLGLSHARAERPDSGRAPLVVSSTGGAWPRRLTSTLSGTDKQAEEPTLPNPGPDVEDGHEAERTDVDEPTSTLGAREVGEVGSGHAAKTQPAEGEEESPEVGEGAEEPAEGESGDEEPAEGEGGDEEPAEGEGGDDDPAEGEGEGEGDDDPAEGEDGDDDPAEGGEYPDDTGEQTGGYPDDNGKQAGEETGEPANTGSSPTGTGIGEVTNTESPGTIEKPEETIPVSEHPTHGSHQAGTGTSANGPDTSTGSQGGGDTNDQGTAGKPATLPTGSTTDGTSTQDRLPGTTVIQGDGGGDDSDEDPGTGISGSTAVLILGGGAFALFVYRKYNTAISSVLRSRSGSLSGGGHQPYSRVDMRNPEETTGLTSHSQDLDASGLNGRSSLNRSGFGGTPGATGAAGSDVDSWQDDWEWGTDDDSFSEV